MKTRIAPLMISALFAAAASADSVPNSVRCGIDVLEQVGFKPLAGRRVALITNHTGRTIDGRRTVDVLFNAAGVELVKLFSPEHGLYGQLDDKVGHAMDTRTGLKVYSLYGDTRRPTSDMLAGVDTLVYDIEDIGTRFYTYISTLGYAMEAAAKHKVAVVVLDRPNPITGLLFDGPIADANSLSFTAYASIPIVHGMTVGELAQMFNAERNIGCDLTVVKMEGWTRSMWWDETGLTWTNPSPNMRNPTQALLYPAIGLLEMSNLSVGRGTDQPFEQLGAPWIEGRRLAAALNGADLPGLRFTPIEFTPASSKFKSELCHGVYIQAIDRRAFQPARTGLTIAFTLNRLFGRAFEIDKVNVLLASAPTLDSLKLANDPELLVKTWAGDLSRFARVREKHLLYR
jgi:uncharacterized protein YbbC (DUF1343 family)